MSGLSATIVDERQADGGNEIHHAPSRYRGYAASVFSHARTLRRPSSKMRSQFSRAAFQTVSGRKAFHRGSYALQTATGASMLLGATTSDRNHCGSRTPSYAS